MSISRIGGSVAGLALGASVALAELPATQRNFVSCPIVRDTQTVPCWLAEYDGELYYLGIQTDVSAEFHPPLLGHRVLVEGKVKDAPRICGGIVLDPAKISPLAELDGTCNTILPAEDRYTVPFAPRPPGPSGGRLAFDPPPGARTAPPPLEGPQEFVLYYDYDMLIGGRHSGLLSKIFDYARTLKSPTITITGYRGATLLSNGESLIEAQALARERATELAKLLTRAGLAPSTIDVKAVDTLAPPDGDDDWQTRRVVVRVEP